MNQLLRYLSFYYSKAGNCQRCQRYSTVSSIGIWIQIGSLIVVILFVQLNAYWVFVIIPAIGIAAIAFIPTLLGYDSAWENHVKIDPHSEKDKELSGLVEDL